MTPEVDTLAPTTRLNTDSEIDRVFDALRLSTYEERAKYLKFTTQPEPKEAPKHAYVTRLSNNSEPFTPKA